MTSTKIMKSFDLEGEKTSYGLLQNDAGDQPACHIGAEIRVIRASVEWRII